ncbi:acyltransferase family protein [Cerasicoccus arenae]|nr:acyltransferase family protein [Cerasicoccus arenae]
MTKYFPGFGYLRIVGIVSVIWIHSCDTAPVAQALNIFNQYAVPVFVLMGVYLIGIHQIPPQDKVAYLHKRLIRLFVPLILWSTVYMVA